MYPRLISLPLEFMGADPEDPQQAYNLERFLKARDVSNSRTRTHRKPFSSVHTALLIEVAGKRRLWNERILRRAWRDILAVEPIRSDLGSVVLYRRLRVRFSARLENPWLRWPLLQLRVRVCEERERFPAIFDPVSRVFLEYALLTLLTADP